MIGIEDVPQWAVEVGIGHAVVSVLDGFMVMTACGTFANTMDLIDHRPHRICRRCREALTRVSLKEPA